MNAVGAYGLRLRGVEGAETLLLSADPAWPELELRQVTTSAGAPAAERVTDDRATIRLRTTRGSIEIDREAARAEYRVPRLLAIEEIVHPFLAPVAAVMAHWLGREAFHAGAVATGGDVWGIVGDRFAGKSSALAALTDRLDVVCDDLLVFEAGTRRVFAGPRSIDLRQESAERLGSGEALGVVGARERWRLRLPPIAGELTLQGWIFLAWGDEVAVRPLKGMERVELLAAQRGLRVDRGDPAFLLELASLPSWELRRPRDWSRLGEASDRLLGAIAG